jgi:(1->4)-alpha-D-glucan 1-alpha-D-glucosylmutase
MANPRKMPAATYRLQLRREFPLPAASGIVPYLRLLGVSDLYLSPLHAARPGSVHGYDVVDHARLNPELGDAGALQRLLDDVHAAGLGVVLDVVPNHMCIAGDANPQWMDVLEDGRDSPSAAHFDVDWEPPKPELVGKVLLPFLGEQYGRVLEGQLSVGFEDGKFSVRWNAERLPLGLGSWRHILEPALSTLRAHLLPEDAAIIELESILRAVVHTLPPLRQGGPERSLEYRHEKEAIRHRLAVLTDGNEAARGAIADAITRLNGTPGNPASFDALERLMDDQCYRLANWRVAAHEVNYRRFFDINDLAAVRVEDPQVFANVHVLPFQIAEHPAFTGFRVDHVDGLSDPQQYLTDLSGKWIDGRGRPLGDPDGRPFVVVEKILGPHETLPSGWLADGTTGYDFIAILAGLFARAEGNTRLRAVAAHFGGLPAASLGDIGYDSKRLVLQTTLAAELTVLARRLDRVSEQHRYTRDFTLNHLQAALGEIIACFPVYRTYVRRDDSEVTGRDAAVIAEAVTCARRRNPLINSSLFDFIESVLLRRDPPGLDQAQIEERRTLVTRFQQLTGPVVAKGIEDTVFYRYLPLVALNEVGGDPGRLGASTSEIHQTMVARHEISPHTLSASATHDTKRGEDTRARLYVLSEVADAWAIATAQWSGLTAAHKTSVDGAPAPDAAEEYLLYQTLVGAWPLGGWGSEPDFADRIRAYMAKARHEAKVRTSWINPHTAYDDAAEWFLNAVLDPERSGAFLDGVEAFVKTIARPGLWNSLSQVLLKVASPGIPDFFQGTELWDFSLVDPDNRRLVDFERRRTALAGMLAEVEARGAAPIDAWFDAPEDAKIKLWITAAALRLRRARRGLFERGGYEPVLPRGSTADHVFSFARSDGDQAVIAVAGRFFATLRASHPTGPAPIGAAWGDTTLLLPAAVTRRRFRDALTGQILTADGDSLSVAAAFNHLPVALLETVP